MPSHTLNKLIAYTRKWSRHKQCIINRSCLTKIQFKINEREPVFKSIAEYDQSRAIYKQGIDEFVLKSVLGDVYVDERLWPQYKKRM